VEARIFLSCVCRFHFFSWFCFFLLTLRSSIGTKSELRDLTLAAACQRLSLLQSKIGTKILSQYTRHWKDRNVVLNRCLKTGLQHNAWTHGNAPIASFHQNWKCWQQWPLPKLQNLLYFCNHWLIDFSQCFAWKLNLKLIFSRSVHFQGDFLLNFNLLKAFSATQNTL